jgi:fucose 4-O-acetylase-like acetyltransferase
MKLKLATQAAAEAAVPWSSCDALWTWASVALETRICIFATCVIFAVVLAFAVLPSCLLSIRRRASESDFAPVSREIGGLLGQGNTRLSWIDNARFLLIASIVFGHVVAIPTLFVPEREYYMQPLLVLSSLYHIPMLSFISGIFSKNALTNERVARLITGVVAPYIFSKTAWWCYYYALSPVTPVFNLFDSYQAGGLEWYLAALVCWRLTLALLAPLSARALMVVSFSLGLVSGYWVGNDQLFALQRALAFFPFAAAGYLFDPHTAQRLLLKTKSIQMVARFILFAMLVYSVKHRMLLSHLDLGTLGDLNFDYYHQRMETRGWVWEARMPCGAGWSLSWTHRVIHYALHFLVGAVFLAAVPAGKCFMTEAGSRTMYPYLLHTWVTMAIAPMLESRQALFHYIVCPGFFPGGWVWSVAGLGALPLTYVLSSNAVRLVFGPLIEPHWIGRLLFKEEAPTPGKLLEEGTDSKFYRRSLHGKS